MSSGKLDLFGSVAGILGLVVCVVAGAFRLSGVWAFEGFGMLALFNMGTGLMVAGCLAKLEVIAMRLRGRT